MRYLWFGVSLISFFFLLANIKLAEIYFSSILKLLLQFRSFFLRAFRDKKALWSALEFFIRPRARQLGAQY